MNQQPILYTYGKQLLTARELIHIIKPYGINCVVDLRTYDYQSTLTRSSKEEMEEALKANGFIHLHFNDHFRIYPPAAIDKRGKVVYKKAIQDEAFLKGVERLRIGLSKGYKIVIIDDIDETEKSIRFNRIGKYICDTFPEQYQLRHLTNNGHYLSQQDIELRIENRKRQRKDKNKLSSEVGINGEEIAGLYLIQHGYSILDRNWNLHKGCELDIVAVKNGKLHFIEVKTRSSDKYGTPESAINYKKKVNIYRALRAYRYRRGLMEKDYQIDSIAIIYRSDANYELKHFEDI